MESIPNPNTPVHRLLDRLGGVTAQGKGWQARCPAHNDREPSLSVDVGNDGRVLLNCFAGCEAEEIVDAVGMTMSDLFPLPTQMKPSRGLFPRQVTATYNYTDEHGNLLFQTVRYEPKSFSQRRPDGRGSWIKNLQGIEPVLYHLQALVQNPDERVWIVEGEKDADRLADIGLLATTAPMGAGKWRDSYTETLRGRDVVILSDNDKPGLRHAERMAASLNGAVTSLRVVTFPELEEKGDVSDWLDLGYTKDDLVELAVEVPEWEPEQHEAIGQPDSSQPAFPLQALPPAIREYCQSAAESISVPVEMVAAPIIAFTGALIGNRLGLLFKEGWIEYPTLYVALVAPPGAAKTPALKYAFWPLQTLQEEAFRTYRAEVARAKAIKAKPSPASDEGDQGSSLGAEPLLRHYVSTDPTIEALIKMLETSPGIAIHRDELVSWIKSMNQYRGGRGADRQAYLDLWSGGTLKVDRKTSETIYRRNPVACVVGGIQPELVSELHHEARQRDGFIERILPVLFDGGPARWTEITVSKAAQAAALELFRAVDRLEHAHGNGVVVPLGKDARTAWARWHDQNAHRVEDTHGLEQGFHLKLPSHVARLALILNALWHPGAPEPQVGENQMAGAIALADFFGGQFAQLLRLLDSATLTEKRGLETRIVRVLHKAAGEREDGWVSRTELSDDLRVSAQELTEALAALEHQGIVERKVQPTATKPAEMWRLKATP